MTSSSQNTLSPLTVGLFGTCGASTWRKAFIEAYERLGVPYFNPQVEDWKPELADLEAWHLANDEVILFPVTGETFGAGSLAETGFSALSAMRWNAQRFVVVYVELTLDEALAKSNPEAAKDSVRARKLVLAHLKEQAPKNVFVVSSLEEMLRVSLRLVAACGLLHDAAGDSSWRSRMAPAFWLQALQATSTQEEACLAA